MEAVKIINTKSILTVREAVIDDSEFECACLKGLYFNDVNLSGTKIINANMSDIEIEGAQLGGAYIHNIGMPPEGHPDYDPMAKQRPLKFENCFLANSEMLNCDLTGIQLNDCITAGMKINGILVDDLIVNFKKLR